MSVPFLANETVEKGQRRSAFPAPAHQCGMPYASHLTHHDARNGRDEARHACTGRRWKCGPSGGLATVTGGLDDLVGHDAGIGPDGLFDLLGNVRILFQETFGVLAPLADAL